MVKIYLVRHGEAMGNVEEFFQGRTDCEISPKGKKQLDFLSERFKDIYFDEIYSSPLKRAAMTADAVNKYHGREIIYDERLTEIDGGVWEGVKWADIPRLYPEEYRLWTEDMANFHIEKGESMTEVYSRITSAVNDIAEKNTGKTIVIVSHGCALRNFLCYAADRDINKLADVGWSDNTAVSLAEYDDSGEVRIIFKNDASHLPPELSTLASSKWNKYEEDK